MASNVFGALLDVAVGVLALTVLAAARCRRPPPARAAGDARAARAACDARAAVAHAAPRHPRSACCSWPTRWSASPRWSTRSCWTRALALVLGSSIYAFSAMLGAFLVGIALGSLAIRRLVDRSARPLALLVLGLCALGVLVARA